MCVIIYSHVSLVSSFIGRPLLMVCFNLLMLHNVYLHECVLYIVLWLILLSVSCSFPAVFQRLGVGIYVE